MVSKKGCGELCHVVDVDEFWVCGENGWLCVGCELQKIGIKRATSSD